MLSTVAFERGAKHPPGEEVDEQDGVDGEEAPRLQQRQAREQEDEDHHPKTVSAGC